MARFPAVVFLVQRRISFLIAKRTAAGLGLLGEKP